jgi:hypothetical protein
LGENQKWRWFRQNENLRCCVIYLFAKQIMLTYFLYIDPGSGSYLVQVIIAAILGVAFFFKNIKLHIQAFFYRLFGKKDKNKPPESKETL